VSVSLLCESALYAILPHVEPVPRVQLPAAGWHKEQNGEGEMSGLDVPLEDQEYDAPPDMAELTAARLDDIRLILGGLFVVLVLILWRVW
jgi:hypothetical protein